MFPKGSLAPPNFIKVDKCDNLKFFRPYRMTFAPEQHEMEHAIHRKSHCIFIVGNLYSDSIYRTRAIITRGLYTFYPLFEVQKRFFKGLFS